MNRKNAKTVSQEEAKDILPKWFNEIFDTTVSMLKTNPYNSFDSISNFVKNSLTYIPPKKTEIKHIVVDSKNKGIKDEFQYVSIIIYIMMSDSDKFVKFSKSMKVRLREKMSYD